MSKIITITLMLLTIALFSGCTNRITDFTIISSKNVDLSEVGKYKRGNSRVTGEDVAHIIIFIPTGIPNLKEAIDRAIESVPGAVALVDGVVYMTNFYIPFIYGQNKYTVEGTPLIKPSDLSKLPSNNIIVSFDSGTNMFTPKFVNEKEFAELKAKVAKSS